MFSVANRRADWSRVCVVLVMLLKEEFKEAGLGDTDEGCFTNSHVAQESSLGCCHGRGTSLHQGACLAQEGECGSES